MVPSPRSLLLGRPRSRSALTLDLLAVATVGLTTLVAYALGVFAVAGGVVFLPGDAALVGLAAAGVLAVRRRGLVLSWLAAYGALLGSAADHYLLGLSGRTLPDRLAALLQFDGLAYLAVLALVLGTVGWLAGSGIRLAVAALAARASGADH